MRLRDCRVGMRVRVKGGARVWLVGEIGTVLGAGAQGAWVTIGDDLTCYFDPRNLEPAPEKKGR